MRDITGGNSLQVYHFPILPNMLLAVLPISRGLLENQNIGGFGRSRRRDGEGCVVVVSAAADALGRSGGWGAGTRDLLEPLSRPHGSWPHPQASRAKGDVEPSR